MTTPRLGLCCTFLEEPIAFRTATAAVCSRLSRAGALEKLADIALANALALEQAIRFCTMNGIGSFRISNGILPLRTHPKVGYIPQLLPGGRQIVERFRRCGRLAADRGLRLTFHPDQFVVLSAHDPAVVESSVEELEHVAELAEWVGADVLIIHGGGAYGDKAAALARFAAVVPTLSEGLRGRLAVENDERTYTPADLLPLCQATGLPLVYDVHHHRCLPDGLGVEAATTAAVATWAGREPLFHISSPKEGWDGPKPARHHDFIDPADFPAAWRSLPVTIEVEAKAKEQAVLKLLAHLRSERAASAP